MPESRTAIQSIVQTWADDTSLSLSTGDGKQAFDQVYLGMFNPDYRIAGVKVGRRWAERTLENTSLTMVAGTSTYTWPTSPIIKSPFFIEGLDVNASNDPYTIVPPPNMQAWSDMDDQNNAQPIYYRLVDSSGVLTLELRPAPDQADPIRITSIAGVTRFPTTDQTTVDVDSAASQAVLSVAATTMVAAGDHVIIGEGTAREERGTILSISAGVSITLVSNLSSAHTQVQADVVELTTIFNDFDTDQALGLYVSALVKAKRGDTGRALELINQGKGLMPLYDSTPTLRSGGFLHPWGIESGFSGNRRHHR